MGETKERLEQIFRDYYQLIYRVAFSQVKNHADAEDITQEVFLKIIRHDMRYQSMEHERAWIVRVTVNLCRDLLKQMAQNECQHGRGQRSTERKL